MGLGGGRRRNKLSLDPNNTSWNRSSDGYGQKLLESKGWTPGASLGARNKPYTRPKDSSYIRVALKDDSLGLGAKSGVNVPPTGLDAFQGLLGRLNGKEDSALEKEQKTRDDLRRAAYTENRWGSLRFVKGGYLVGDKIEDSLDDGSTTSSSKGYNIGLLSQQTVSSTIVDVTEVASSALLDNTSAGKSSNKAKKLKSHAIDDWVPGSDVFANEDGHKVLNIEEATNSNVTIAAANRNEVERRAKKAKRKLARQVRREERQSRRLENAKEKQTLGPNRSVPSDPAKISMSPERAHPTASSQDIKSGRHNVRSRYVQQKKMALMDPKALNEILMVKA